MLALWPRCGQGPVLFIMFRRHAILTCNSADRAGALHYMPLNYFFAFPAQQITNTGGDSTPDMRALNETRRGIKNNKGMANCAQHSSLISEAVYFDDGQFLPSAAGLRTSVNFYDWLLSSVLTGGMRRWRPGPGLCVKCFYSHSVSQDWGQDWRVRQPIIREISVSTQTPGH